MPRGLTESVVKLRGNSTAAFTHWTVPLAERWTVEAGARVERDEIRFRPEGDTQRRADWTRVTPRVALQYAFAPRQQAYLSVSDGFRAGGFNVFSPAANYAPYQPETLRAYEIGAKGWLPGNRLRYSSAVYVMTVKNMQVQQMPLPGLVYVTNAASARSVGAEFGLEYLLGDGWSAGWKSVSCCTRSRKSFHAVTEDRRKPASKSCLTASDALRPMDRFQLGVPEATVSRGASGDPHRAAPSR